jgi:uncharacterized protein YbaR (Trm112 family)
MRATFIQYTCPICGNRVEYHSYATCGACDAIICNNCSPQSLCPQCVAVETPEDKAFIARFQLGSGRNASPSGCSICCGILFLFIGIIFTFVAKRGLPEGTGIVLFIIGAVITTAGVISQRKIEKKAKASRGEYPTFTEYYTYLKTVIGARRPHPPSIVKPTAQDSDKPLREKFPHDDMFKDQANVVIPLRTYEPDDWMEVKRAIDTYFYNALTRFTQGAERVDHGTNVDLGAIDPRTHPRSDASFKLAAFERFEKEGYQHPENLPVYYEDEARKMEEKTRQLLAVMPRMACPGCGSELYTFEEDKTKPMGRDLVTGKTAYGSVFTCKACGRRYSQVEGQGRK